MAKRKKKKRASVPPPRPVEKAGKTDLEKGLQRAERLIARGSYREALRVLEDLNEQYPNQTDVLLLMGDAFYELKDYDDYLRVSYRLHQLMPTTRRRPSTWRVHTSSTAFRPSLW